MLGICLEERWTGGGFQQDPQRTLPEKHGIMDKQFWVTQPPLEYIHPSWVLLVLLLTSLKSIKKSDQKSYTVNFGTSPTSLIPWPPEFPCFPRYSQDKTTHALVSDLPSLVVDDFPSSRFPRDVGIMSHHRIHTVDGSEIRRSPVEVGSLWHYLQGFIYPRWCRISSIDSKNAMMEIGEKNASKTLEEVWVFYQKHNWREKSKHHRIGIVWKEKKLKKPISDQIVIFHQPRFPCSKGRFHENFPSSPTKAPTSIAVACPRRRRQPIKNSWNVSFHDETQGYLQKLGDLLKRSKLVGKYTPNTLSIWVNYPDFLFVLWILAKPPLKCFSIPKKWNPCTKEKYTNISHCPQFLLLHLHLHPRV